MLQALELFQIAAEELNFSKAAQRGFVTQQCLSDHIKRLEAQYGVPLFNRKPKISLTEYGAALQRAVQNIKVIETNLEKELHEIAQEERGTVVFGINATRARAILPRIYPRFYEKYPFVNLEIQMNETRSMEKLILNGKMDMFLGVDAMFHPNLTMQPVCSNPLYCALSAAAFRQVFGADASPADFKNGISIKDLAQLPFFLCLPESTTRQLVEQTLSRKNIYLQNTFSISDYEIHFDICAQKPLRGGDAGHRPQPTVRPGKPDAVFPHSGDRQRAEHPPGVSQGPAFHQLSAQLYPSDDRGDRAGKCVRRPVCTETV